MKTMLLLFSQFCRVVGYLMIVSFLVIVSEEGFFMTEIMDQFIMIITTLGMATVMFSVSKKVYEQRLIEEMPEPDNWR